VAPPQCACELFLASDRKVAVFVSGINGESARMNVDGQDVSLTLQRQVLLSELDPKAGPGFERTYLHGTTPIRAEFSAGDYVTGEGKSEGRRMHVIFSIPRGTKTETLRASGICGC
jgi:hypothetical protein